MLGWVRCAECWLAGFLCARWSRGRQRYLFFPFFLYARPRTLYAYMCTRHRASSAPYFAASNGAQRKCSVRAREINDVLPRAPAAFAPHASGGGGVSWCVFLYIPPLLYFLIYVVLMMGRSWMFVLISCACSFLAHILFFFFFSSSSSCTLYSFSSTHIYIYTYICVWVGGLGTTKHRRAGTGGSVLCQARLLGALNSKKGVTSQHASFTKKI